MAPRPWLAPSVRAVLGALALCMTGSLAGAQEARSAEPDDGVSSSVRASEIPADAASQKKTLPPRLPRPPLTPDSAARLSQDLLANILSLRIDDELSFFRQERGQVANALALKPVIPFPVRRWLVVTRWTLPVSRVPDVTTTSGAAHGLGDIDMTTWLVPPQEGPWKFGMGVGKGFATATTDELSTLGWSVGPAFIAIYEQEKWIASVATSYSYSLSTDSQTYSMQNSFAYSLGSGWALVSEPDVTGIWQNEDQAGWLVPLGGGVEKTWVVGRLAIGVGVAGYYNVVRPDYVGRFTLHTELRLFVQGLQPRRWVEDRLPWPR